MYLVEQAISDDLQAVSHLHFRIPKSCSQIGVRSSCRPPFLTFELPTASCCDDRHARHA